MSQNAGFDDSGIPVLTEVVDETPASRKRRAISWV
jgi:hypothetical protein